MLGTENKITQPKKNITSIKSSSRSSEIYDVIREAIIAGAWLPGDRIDDNELAKQLGVSRLSVREALSKLYESRIVERVHWKGFFLRELSIEEVKSIIEIRIALEKVAIENVMKKCSPEFYDELEEVINYAEEALIADDQAEYMARDFKFHSTIYRASGNSWIEIIVENLRVLINILRNVSMKPDFKTAAKKSTEDHRLICSLMKAGDLERTMKELTAHMELFYNNVIKEL
jgi:DNA-binding GntR family transcriptional regulator